MVQCSDIVLIIVTIIFPPATAWYLTGCSCDLLLTVLLTILGYLPGHAYAFWLLYKKIKAEKRYGHGGYTYLGSGRYQGVNQNAPVNNVNQVPNYGTTTK